MAWDFLTGFASEKTKQNEKQTNKQQQRQKLKSALELLSLQLEFPISGSKMWTDVRR